VKRETSANLQRSQSNYKKIKWAINEYKSSCSVRSDNLQFIKTTMKGNVMEKHRLIVMENESLGQRLINRTPSVNNRKFIKD